MRDMCKHKASQECSDSPQVGESDLFWKSWPIENKKSFLWFNVRHQKEKVLYLYS